MEVDPRSSEEKMSALSPWRHEHKLGPSSFCIVENSFVNKFVIYDVNADLDIYSKRAALRSSESVASLVSYIDEEMAFCASGTIIECKGDEDGMFDVIVLSTANLLRSSDDEDTVVSNLKIIVLLWDGKSYEGEIAAYDFHYNLAAIRIRSEVTLRAAILQDMDDSMSIYPYETSVREVGFLGESKKPILRRHSKKFSITPGDKVIALGRYYTEQYQLMVAPGIFSADSCRLDCKELCRANCKISKSGIGGPLLNLDGEVIGINFFSNVCTPFLPSNVASRWWSHFKKYGEFRRPWLGMEVTNLYSGRVNVLEHVVRKFPDISKGVIVEMVANGSPAHTAGINPNDVIVQCDGKKVRSFLELFKRICGKVGKKVELLVIRPVDGTCLTVSVVVSEATNVNRWRLPGPRQIWKRRRQG